jgi:hypothetical protein
VALKFPSNRHPGSEYIQVECDVCHGWFYRYQVVRVTNKYSTQHGMVVCQRDFDEINEQSLPNRIREGKVPSPELLRPKRDPIFATNPNDDRLPSAPRLGQTRVNPLDDYIDLYWQGPEDPGSSAIIGYIIARANPQLANYIIVETMTTNPTYYTDTSADVNMEYSYKVAAYNGFGTGPYSEEFFWPVKRVPFDIVYLGINNGTDVLGTSSGDSVILYPEV